MIKTTLRSLLAITLAVSCYSWVVAAPKSSPRFKAQIACFNGAADHGSSCTGTSFQPDGTLHTEGEMTCGILGQVSKITWSFVERRGDKDIYHFIRRFPADDPKAAVSSKDVEFSDGRIIIFKDDHQTILIEPPEP